GIHAPGPRGPQEGNPVVPVATAETKDKAKAPRAQPRANQIIPRIASTLPPPRGLRSRDGFFDGNLLAPNGERIVFAQHDGSFGERPLPDWEPMIRHQIDAKNPVDLGTFTPDGRKMTLIAGGPDLDSPARLLLWDWKLKKVT